MSSEHVPFKSFSQRQKERARQVAQQRANRARAEAPPPPPPSNPYVHKLVVVRGEHTRAKYEDIADADMVILVNDLGQYEVAKSREPAGNWDIRVIEAPEPGE